MVSHLTYNPVDIEHPQRRHSVRTVEAISAVERSVEGDPNEGILQCAKQFEMRPSTQLNILEKDPGIQAYGIQLVQELKSLDHRKCREFVEWPENKILLDPAFK